MKVILRSAMRVVLGVLVGLGFLFLGMLLAFRQPTLGAADWILEVSASPDHLQRHVRYLTEEVEFRDADHPQQLRLAADYVRRQFDAGSGRVEEQLFEVRGVEYRNVISSFGPEDGPRLVIGAHYDSCGLFGINPGADDNASGVAGLMEMGRLMALHSPRLRVDLVAFANEEPPNFASPGMGSDVYARALRKSNVQVEFMVSLEMIGFFTEKQPWPNWLYGLFYPDRGDFIAIVGRFSDSGRVREVKRGMRGSTVPVFSFTGPKSLAGLDASDHRSFWRQGYEAVMVTDTAFVRNPNYHTPRDKAETLDYVRMAGVVDGLVNMVVQTDVR